MTNRPPRLVRGPSRRRARRSIVWLPCAIAFCGSLGLPLAVQAESGLFYTPPPGGDVLSSWLRHRAEREGADIALHDAAAYERDFLVDGTSIYSNLRTSERIAVGPAWLAARHEMTRAGYTMSDADAVHAVAWDLGLTKSLPNLQAPRMPEGFDGAAYAGFNLFKSGVAVDTYVQARRIVGRKHFAIAANYAVAAAILQEKLARYPEHRTSGSSGLHDGVLSRFMRAQSAADISAFDATYLMNLLAGELSSWRGGRLSLYGHRQLPPMFRIARVAAAYRDDEGYEDTPCGVGGSARDIAATSPDDTHRNLCFVDATDRAVHAWYRRHFDAQTSLDAITSPDWPLAANHLMVPALRMRPLWIGAFRPSIQSEEGSVEVIEQLASMRAFAEDDNSVGALHTVRQGAMDRLCREVAP